MTAPVFMTEHSVEDLAAFIDDRLSVEQKRKVMVHLAECEDCRSEFELASDIAESERGQQNVTRGRFGTPQRIAAAVAVAAAAAIVYLTPLRDSFSGSPMEPVESAVQKLEQRPMRARVAESFAYLPAKPTMRGGDEEKGDTNYTLLSARGRIQERAEKYPSARNLHALGVALMYEEKHEDDAVAALERARAKDPKDDAILLDYAAALLARGQKRSGAKDITAALAICDGLLERDPKNPTALFNRAVALELLGRDPEAVTAYRAYMAVDPNSPWAKEANDRLPILEDR